MQYGKYAHAYSMLYSLILSSSVVVIVVIVIIVSHYGTKYRRSSVITANYHATTTTTSSTSPTAWRISLSRSLEQKPGDHTRDDYYRSTTA
jgi:hypothetical protein